MVTRTKKTNALNIAQDEEIKILRRIVDITCSNLELKNILKEIVAIINGAINADSIFVYLFEESSNRLKLMAARPLHKKAMGQVVLKMGEGITGWVAKRKKPVAISQNAYQDARFKNFDMLPEDQFEAFLSVPIIFKGAVIGVINIQHKAPHVYSQASINFFETIAKQVGGVLEHARLYEEIKTKAAQFDSLVKVSQTITSEEYLDEILNLIVVVTAEMLNSKICSIMLLDQDGKELSIKATQSLSQEYRVKPNIKVESSLVGEVVKTRKALTVLDVRKEKGYYYRELAVKEKLSSMIAVPMIVKQKAIGIINVYTKQIHAFTEEEISVLQMVANQAAVAIENTHLMEETLKAKEALATRKLIERAKGVLMRMNNLTEETAHRMIHKKSMDSCRSMKEIAESIILMDEFQKQ